MNSNCSNLLDMRNLQEQVKKAFCYQKLFWPFTVWINCSSDLKNFANSRPSASNFKSFSRSLEQFFLTVGQNNFGNKIPFFTLCGFLQYFCAVRSNYDFQHNGMRFQIFSLFTFNFIIVPIIFGLLTDGFFFIFISSLVCTLMEVI